MAKRAIPLKPFPLICMLDCASRKIWQTPKSSFSCVSESLGILRYSAMLITLWALCLPTLLTFGGILERSLLMLGHGKPLCTPQPFYQVLTSICHHCGTIISRGVESSDSLYCSPLNIALSSESKRTMLLSWPKGYQWCVASMDMPLSRAYSVYCFLSPICVYTSLSDEAFLPPILPVILLPALCGAKILVTCYHDALWIRNM